MNRDNQLTLMPAVFTRLSHIRQIQKAVAG